ncbi:MAG: alpha-N-arabinofuranosidase [Acidobacteria bacterium]|nr:alpha-N-arabinofuranosidase [Acidobacteriota bacterium]
MNYGLQTASCLLTLASCAVCASAQVPTLSVDATKRISEVSPTLYGLMTEEINYSYDGGLYAEMVRDRFFGKTWSAWSPVIRGDAVAKFGRGKGGPSKALSGSYQLTIERASKASPAGIANSGFWGMAVMPSTKYRGSFYAAAKGISTARALLVDDNTGSTLAEASVPLTGEKWKQYTFELRTNANVSKGAAHHLEILFDQPGEIRLQLVSLFPPTYHDRPNGFRPDLMQMMAAMKPNFLRLPGGNYLEGDTIAERFNWKETIGPLVDRPTHRSPWGYESSDGMGLLEMLEWCEDLHMEPVLAVYAGYSLKGQYVVGKDLEPYVREALEEIEYVTGDSTTTWGARRAADGHPAPFVLRYVEIGNEDEYDKSKSYDDRFEQMARAIRDRYPQLKLIATTRVSKGSPDIIDDHYYRLPDEFFALIHKYDNMSRSGPKIFVGEWATRTGSPTPDFGAALGDAAWMTSLERNSDLIIMASYAPLFTNVNPGGMQWSSDLIGYTADHAYGSPSYWAQVLFAQHLGQSVVQSQSTHTGDRFFWSATTSAKTLHLKLVNASNRPLRLAMQLKGVASGSASMWSLHAATRWATNSITHPRNIIPVQTSLPVSRSLHLTHQIPANTIQVIDLPLRR